MRADAGSTGEGAREQPGGPELREGWIKRAGVRACALRRGRRGEAVPGLVFRLQPVRPEEPRGPSLRLALEGGPGLCGRAGDGP